MIAALRADDPEFDAESRLVFARPPYQVGSGHELPRALLGAAAAVGCRSAPVGMSFWTDAAILGGAGIPSVLFGPGGAGLHSTEEYVAMREVLLCRDALAELIRWWV
jgi:acetylornithine deacetylase